MVNFTRIPPDANLYPTGKPYWRLQISPLQTIHEEGLECNECLPPSDDDKPTPGENMINFP